MGTLKRVEGGLPVPDVCRELGIGSATFYKWRAKFGGMDTSMMARMNLDSAVGRARVCRCQPPREGATTLRTFVRKAEQRTQGGWQRCNRVRSALTWRVKG